MTFVEPDLFTAVPATSTTRSPVAMTPDARAVSIVRFHRSSTSARRRHDERQHAPLQRHLLHRHLVVREPDHRPARAQPRDLGRRTAGRRRGEDRASRSASPRDPVAAFDIARRRRSSRSTGQLVAVLHRRLDRARDRVHRPHRLDRDTRRRPSRPESMIAEVPSRIAFATSLASARVGSACSTIDSSICVAVITGFPASRQRRMICFWCSGTVAAPISTPRSPRATISASDSSSTSSRSSIASAFSIFAITRAVEPRSLMSACRSRTSAAARTNDSAT